MRLSLGQAAEVLLGRQRAPQFEQGDDMVPYLRSANIVDGDLNLTDVKHMNFTPAEQKVFGLRAGDVLVTEGSGSRETVGTSAVWRGEIAPPVCFQNTLLRLRPRAGLTDGRFLAWWARHARASGEIAAVSSGANILHIGSDGLKRLKTYLPPLAEQRRIADLLDDRVARIDRVILARREQMATLGRVREARMQQLQDDLVIRHGECRLGYLIVGLEQGWSPQAESTPAAPQEWGVVRSGCINGGIFRPEDNKRLPDDLKPRVEYEIQSGDLLMSRASGSLDLIGSVAVVPAGTRPRLLLCDKIYRISPARSWSPDYLAHIMSTRRSREHIRLGVSGAEGMANNLPSGVVRDLCIPLVSKERQAEIVRRAEMIVNGEAIVIAGLNQSIELLREYKSSLITAAVTGEIDVTTAGSGIPG